MDKLLIITTMMLQVFQISAQHLYLEVYGGANRTAFEFQRFNTSDDFYTFGGRLAAGADHFQIGAEYFTNQTNPVFSSPLASEEFQDSYYGAFLRTNISRFPAMRLGLVLRAGAGIYTTDLITRVPPSSPVFLTESYSPYLGLNAGAGFSIPLLRATMLQLGYTFHYVKKPLLDAAALPKFQANIHSIQAGLSLNFVFGKRAEKYREIRSSRMNVSSN